MIVNGIFEEEDNDINVFDIKELHQASLLEHRKFFSRFYQMKGLIGRLWKRNDFDAYLMIGAPMCISIWILCLLLRIFYPSKKYIFGHMVGMEKSQNLKQLLRRLS